MVLKDYGTAHMRCSGRPTKCGTEVVLDTIRRTTHRDISSGTLVDVGGRGKATGGWQGIRTGHLATME